MRYVWRNLGLWAFLVLVCGAAVAIAGCAETPEPSVREQTRDAGEEWFCEQGLRNAPWCAGWVDARAALEWKRGGDPTVTLGYPTDAEYSAADRAEPSLWWMATVLTRTEKYSARNTSKRQPRLERGPVVLSGIGAWSRTEAGERAR